MMSRFIVIQEKVEVKFLALQGINRPKCSSLAGNGIKMSMVINSEQIEHQPGLVSVHRLTLHATQHIRQRSVMS